MSAQGFSIGGGLVYTIAHNEFGEAVIDQTVKYYCDYCGDQIWKGHSVTYDNEAKTFSLCNLCLPKMFAAPEEGKVLMLERTMAESAKIK